MRRLGILAAVLAMAVPAAAHDDHHDARRMVFPAAVSGGAILPVDLHTHSVFSDGNVWPSIRVQEAVRDGLAAMAVTEHLEYQPHAADIPHPDRNRSFQLATDLAKATSVLIIPGAEITRDMPPGHVNAVFISDANGLRREDGEAAIRAANEQGGFVFWNHPYWYRQQPDGVARLTPMHEKLIAAKQLHGIEVANGANYSESALQIALANNLVILGTSDIHGLIDWEYDLHEGGHRTVTLALAAQPTLSAIRDALRAGRTVAWFNDTLIGRPAMVEEVVRSSLSVTPGGPLNRSQVLSVTLKNASPVRYTLRFKGRGAVYNHTDVVVVPPYGAVDLQLTGGVKPADVALDVEVLSSIVAPRQTLSLVLRPR